MVPERLCAVKLIDVHPDHVLFAAEPGELSFGKVARVPLDEPYGLVEVIFALQMAVDLLVAYALHGCAVSGDACVPKAGDFLKKSGLHHEIDPAVDPLVKLLTVHCEDHEGGPVGGLSAPLLGIVRSDGLTALFQEFQCADDALDIVGVDGSS